MLVMGYVPHIIILVITLQMCIICGSFYFNNRKVNGFGSLALSSLFLFLGYNFSFHSKLEFYSLTHYFTYVSFALSNYLVLVSFLALLEIRSYRKVEKYWLLSLPFSCIVVFLFNESLVGLILLKLLLLAPFIYLNYLIGKKLRAFAFMFELQTMLYFTHFIIMCHVLALIPVVLPDLFSEELSRHIRTVFEFCLVMTYLSLLMSFLVLMFKRKELQLKKATETDHLTGLFNRKAFFEKVSKKRNLKELYFVMVDADHFKRINDNYGHLAGDEALKLIAKTISESLSKYDLCARYGGEEFIIAVPNISRADIGKVAERIRSNMEATPLVYEGKTIPITLSIGVAKFNGKDFVKDIDTADSMLYRAKKQGRNRAVFCDELDVGSVGT